MTNKPRMTTTSGACAMPTANLPSARLPLPPLCLSSGQTKTPGAMCSPALVTTRHESAGADQASRRSAPSIPHVGRDSHPAVDSVGAARTRLRPAQSSQLPLRCGWTNPQGAADEQGTKEDKHARGRPGNGIECYTVRIASHRCTSTSCGPLCYGTGDPSAGGAGDAGAVGGGVGGTPLGVAGLS